MLTWLGFGMDDFRLKNEGFAAEPSSDAVVRPSRKPSGSNSSEWLVNVEEDVVVPMLTSEIVEAFRAGRITERSLVWRIGMHAWSALAEVPQLRLAVGSSTSRDSAWAAPVVVGAAAGAAPDQPRRSTLPFGFPALRDAASVREPNGLGLPAPAASPSKQTRAADSEAIAVYERPAASLTFAGSMRDEWQGRPSSPALSPARLTPVPPASSRLPNRKHSLAPNTLSPTTAEAAIAESARRLGAFGDKSVVFASELRAAKKTSKRAVLWTAFGSAVLASIATFLIARSASQPADQGAVAPSVAAAVHEAPVPIVATQDSAPASVSAASLVSAAHAPSVPPKRPALRAIQRAKPAPARAVSPAPDAVTSSLATDPSDENAVDAKLSVAASLPLGAPLATTSAAASPSAAPPAPSVERVAPAPDL